MQDNNIEDTVDRKDNIIEFKKKGEDTPPPEERNILVDIKIRDNGSLVMWLSNAIQEPDEIDWVKEMAFNALYTLGQVLDDIDDRYVEHTVGEKDHDELDNE